MALANDYMIPSIYHTKSIEPHDSKKLKTEIGKNIGFEHKIFVKNFTTSFNFHLALQSVTAREVVLEGIPFVHYDCRCFFTPPPRAIVTYF